MTYNNFILKISNINTENINPNSGFLNYGIIKNDYIVLKGSIPGAKKRAILLKNPIRPTKLKNKQNYEVMEIR